MEPNTSSSAAAAATSPAATAAAQPPSSVHAQSLLPPPPPPSLASASSPAMVDDPSLTAATHPPTLLAGRQPTPPPASPGLPVFLSGEIPGFAAKLMLLEQLAAWQRKTPLVSPPPSGSGSSSGSGLPPPPPSPDYELPPLPESLRIPELEEARNMSSTIGVIEPSNCGGSSAAAAMDIESSSSTPKLCVGAEKKKPSRFLHLPPWSDGNAPEVNFNKYEKEIISKDRSLQDLVNTDPKKVKRLIAYRVCAAKRKVVKDRHAIELERQVEELQMMHDTKSVELQLVQAQRAELQAEQTEMSVKVHELNRQVMLKDGKEIIKKDKHLQELVNTDPTKVLR